MNFSGRLGIIHCGCHKHVFLISSSLKLNPPHLSLAFPPSPFLPSPQPSPTYTSDLLALGSFLPPYCSLSPLYHDNLHPTVTSKTDLKRDLRILLIQLLQSKKGKLRPEVMK